MRHAASVSLIGLAMFTGCAVEHQDVASDDTGENTTEALSGTSSRLANKELAKANGRIFDYSYAGYRHGEAEIPAPAVATNVKSFGAQGDGVHDDTDAFIRAIDQTASGAILVPAGRYVITRRIKIEKPSIVIRGEGQGKTILEFPKSLSEVDNVPPSNFGGTSPYSFGPGFINVNGADQSAALADVTAGALRGDRVLSVSTTAGMSPGQWVTLVETDVDNSLARRLYGDEADPGDDLTGDNLVHFQSRIASINGNTVTLERRLPVDVETRWKPSLRTVSRSVKEVGIEHLTIHFKGSTYPGHFKELGYNAIVMNGVADSWVQDVAFTNIDLGVVAGGSFSTTLADLTFDTDVNRGPLAGHHALWIKEGGDNLVTRFHVNKKWVHDLSVERTEIMSVFSDGSGVDLNMDHHRDAPYATLFSNLDLGAGTRAFASGGAADRGAHSAAFSTFWNLRSRRTFALPPADFGPLLTFIGVNTSTTSVPDATWRLDRIAPSALTPADLQAAQRTDRVHR